MATQVAIVAGGLGVNPGPVAADGTGNYVVPGASDKRLVIRVNNGGGSPITLTLDDPNTPTPEGAAAINPDAVITITNGQPRAIVLSGARFRRFLNTSNGRISWTYSGVTTVTVEAISVP